MYIAPISWRTRTKNINFEKITSLILHETYYRSCQLTPRQYQGFDCSQIEFLETFSAIGILCKNFDIDRFSTLAIKRYAIEKTKTSLFINFRYFEESDT